MTIAKIEKCVDLYRFSRGGDEASHENDEKKFNEIMASLTEQEAAVVNERIAEIYYESCSSVNFAAVRNRHKLYTAIEAHHPLLHGQREDESVVAYKHLLRAYREDIGALLMAYDETACELSVLADAAIKPYEAKHPKSLAPKTQILEGLTEVHDELAEIRRNVSGRWAIAVEHLTGCLNGVERVLNHIKESQD